MTQKKHAWPMFTLATITLVLSSYGLFELAHNYAQAPWLLSVLAVAGFDLTAMAAGRQALLVARDGDSAAPWMLLLTLAACLSAVLQYAHNALEGRPWATGVMFAMFPLATVLLFEGTLRRTHRLSGRRTGRIAHPRATFELLQWIFYPKATLWAFRRAIADRSLGGQAAFMLGIQATTVVQVETDETADERRKFEWTYTNPDGGQIREIQPDRPADRPADAPESAGPAPDTRPLTELVQESLQVRGADLEAVKADVLKLRPTANPDSIRRTFGKLSGPKAANG